MTRLFSRRNVLVLAGAALPLALPASAALAHSYTSHGLFIGHVWSPAGAGPDLPVYGPLLNRGAQPDALVSAHSDWAKSVRFERMEEGKPVSIDEIALPPGKPVTLAPWTLHLVLSGLTRPARPGDRIPITLTFRDAGTLSIESLVQAQPGQ